MIQNKQPSSYTLQQSPASPMNAKLRINILFVKDQVHVLIFLSDFTAILSPRPNQLFLPKVFLKLDLISNMSVPFLRSMIHFVQV